MLKEDEIVAGKYMVKYHIASGTYGDVYAV